MDMQQAQALEDAAWSSAYGIATAQQTALLDADPQGWKITLERLADRAEDLLKKQEPPSADGDDEADGDGARASLEEIRALLRAALADIDVDASPKPRTVAEVPQPPVRHEPEAETQPEAEAPTET